MGTGQLVVHRVRATTPAVHPPGPFRKTGPMGGERELFDFFDDLEGQAEALLHAERSAEVADRVRSEYHAVTLDGRLMASTGRELGLDLVGVGRINGLLSRVGPQWCEVEQPAARWVVRTAAVTGVHGASERSVPDVAWTPVQRLGVASALRRLADAGETCWVLVLDGSRHEGRLHRVGADFVELVLLTGQPVLVPLAHLAAVRGPV